MSMDYIRKTYGLSVKRGDRCVVYGKKGTVVGTRGPHLRIKLDDDAKTRSYHPTEEVRWVVT